MNARLLLMTLLGLTLCISCSKDDSVDGVYSDSYFFVEVSGPTFAGSYRIDADDDISQLETTGAVAPSNDPQVPDILLLTYHDYADLDVNMIIPAEKGTFEVVENGEFGLGIRIGDAVLNAKSVFLTITHFQTSNLGLIPGFVQPDVVIASFSGEMTYVNDMGEEEDHAVSGDFEFYQQF